MFDDWETHADSFEQLSLTHEQEQELINREKQEEDDLELAKESFCNDYTPNSITNPLHNINNPLNKTKTIHSQTKFKQSCIIHAEKHQKEQQQKAIERKQKKHELNIHSEIFGDDIKDEYEEYSCMEDMY
jgi:hypothetical protein